MINNKSNFLNDLSKLNNIKSKSCDFFNNVPMILWIILGIIFIYLLYSFFNSNKKNSNNYDEENFIKEDSAKNNNSNSIYIYNFNTKWCHWSKHIRPEWEKFSDYIKKFNQENPYLNIEALDIDCDDPKNKDLISKYDIQGFPTIIFELPNKHTYIYDGERTANKLLEKLDEILTTSN